MARLKAVHQIEGIEGKAVISPGELFELRDPGEVERLISLGAAEAVEAKKASEERK